MIRVHGTDTLAIYKERYAQEKRVAVSLAKHVAELLSAINNHKPDWNSIYCAAHVREANK